MMKTTHWFLTVCCVLLWLGSTLHAQPQPTREPEDKRVTEKPEVEREQGQELFFSLCGRARHICFTNGWCARRKECEKKKERIRRHMIERYTDPPDYKTKVICYKKNHVHRCALSIMS